MLKGRGGKKAAAGADKAGAAGKQVDIHVVGVCVLSALLLAFNTSFSIMLH